MVESEGYEHYLTAKVLFLNNEESEEILSHAKLAIELGLSTSEEAEIHQLLGYIHVAQENFSEAEVEIKKALELDEKSNIKLNGLLYSSSCIDLAKIYQMRGDIPQAITCLEDAIIHLQSQYAPSKENVSIAKVFNELGYVYMSHPNELASAYEQCFQNLQRSLKINPEYYATYLYLGTFHGGEEITEFYDPQKAIDYYEQCLTLMGPPDSDDSRMKIGRKMAQEHLERLKKEVKSSDQEKEEPKKKGFLKKLFG